MAEFVNTNSSWLEPPELKKFNTSIVIVRNSKNELEKINKQVASENVAINKDGSISTRSNLGKKLFSKSSQLTEEIEENQLIFKNFDFKRKDRWKTFTGNFSRFQATTWSLFILIITFVILSEYLFSGFSNIISFLFNKTVTSEGAWKPLLLTLAITQTAYFLIKRYFTKKITKKFPLPEDKLDLSD